MPTSLVRTLWATQLVEPGLATNVIRAVLACGVSAIFVVSSSSLKNGCAMPKVPYFRGMPRGRECAATVGLWTGAGSVGRAPWACMGRAAEARIANTAYTPLTGQRAVQTACSAGPPAPRLS